MLILGRSWVKRYLPQRAKHTVIIPKNIQQPRPPGGVCHKRTQRELQLGHVARKLQLPSLSEGLNYRCIEYKRPNHVFSHANCPVATIFRMLIRQIANRRLTNPEQLLPRQIC